MPERIAFLVIHGIGQERPYETLDRFARNLKNCLPGNWNVEPQLDRATDPTHVSTSWVRAALRLTPQDDSSIPYKSDPASSFKDITLFEYYWAPITQDKITYSGSLLFLVKAGLKPFFNLASNVTAISEASGGDRAKVGRVFVHEVWRQVCLFLPMLALLLWLIVWLTSPGTFSYFHDFKPNAARLVVLGVLAVRYLFLYTCIRGLARSVTPGGARRKSWWLPVLWAGLLCHVFAWPFLLAPFAHGIASVGSAIALHLPGVRILGHWSNATRSFAELVRAWPPLPGGSHPAPPPSISLPVWMGLLDGFHKLLWFLFLDPSLAAYFHPAVAVVLVLFLRFVFANIVGDVAVYANSDSFSSSYAARTQILEECSASLTAILLEKDDDGKPVYDRVLIAGHSLGSVIAYDTMNQLRNAVRTSVPPGPTVSGISGLLSAYDLERLRGMVTFGCPLNKFFYFFRDMGDQTLTLRTQTLDLLHGFRLNARIQADVPEPKFKFVPPPSWVAADQALAKDFTWINVYSPLDPISGHILFYDVKDEDQLSLPHMTPLVAHVQYWERSDFYTFVSAKLL